jgi:magnesium-transporting ATPase (P-type)
VTLQHLELDAPRNAFHAEPVDAVMSVLETSPQGLGEDEAAGRLETFGPNAVPRRTKTPGVIRFLRHFHNALIYVLLASAIVTASLGHPIDTAVILFVVLANAVIGFVQEGRAEAAMEAIETLLSPHASVWRDGERRTVEAVDLVPGDIVFIEAGDRVPADLRLVEATRLQIQEAILTGESVGVDKATDPVEADCALGDRSSMAFSGTIVTAGTAQGIVTATGQHTEIGQISGLLSSVSRLQTPLLQQMNVFAKWLTLLILLIGAALLSFGVFIRRADFSETFMSVVGLSVAAIPEGLPAVLTITMAIGVRAMADKNAIVRRLPAIETLGAVSVICTDKTGTLTRNEMFAASLVVADKTFEVSGEGYAPEGSLNPVSEPGAPGLEVMAKAAVLCNDSALVQQDGHWQVSGDPMEGALLALGGKLLASVDETKASHPRQGLIPFDASYRFMASLNAGPDGAQVFVKGAPEAVVSLCGKALVPSGESIPLDPDSVAAETETLAAKGQRVIAIAMKDWQGDRSLDVDNLKGELTFVGLVGLVDPPRAEAVDAVAACRAAGIDVKMITGDHAGTAAAIAAEIGIENPDQVLSGDDIERLDDRALIQAALDTHVFARASPEHKLRLVKTLQSQNLIVAMTGDGVNDAPALKRADVGVAMGLKGSEAAKEAAPMVLADDNFASIAGAVTEGRRVYDNIQKLVRWTLPTGGGEASVVILALLFGLTLPITPVQILWINLITEMTLGLALALEPLEPATMKAPPRKRDAPLLGPGLLWDILVATVLFAATVFSVFTYTLNETGSVEMARTVAFNTLVVLQVAYLFFVRYQRGPSTTLEGLKGTPAVWAAIAVVVIGQLTVTYLPAAQEVFGTTDLSVRFGAIVIGAGVVVYALLEVEKQLRLAVRGNPLSSDS